MTLRKIKDLIREMVFENQSNAHEYANVMANLVFDRNKADEYETKLDTAEKTANDYDIEIKQINAELDKAKSNRNEIIAKKKELSVAEFKSAIEQANQIVKGLENKQRTTIEEKIQKGFRNLSPTIKKYGCLRYLANEYVKNSDFQTEIGKDGFIYADEDTFKSSSMANNFREISDYVDYIFGNRESKITEPKSIVDIIRADAKELNITVDKLTPENIVNIYNNLLTRIAEENRTKQTEKEQIEQSQIGIEPVSDFGDGLVMYRLLPDTEYYNEHGEHRNLVYEGNQMGICIGQKGQSYSQKILDQGENQYYTLRSRNKNGQLIPHCTIEVNGDAITQVKGTANKPVNGRYIKQVREFLKQYLNCAFPGEENTENKRKLYDYNNIGFIKDKQEQTVDIFKLPPNTEFGAFTYDLLTTKGVDTQNIKSIDTFIWANVGNKEITQEDIDIIQKKYSVKKFDFSKAKLRGKYDFSNVKEIYLREADLTDAEIIFNPNAESINLSEAKLRGKYDFSNVKQIYLSGTDLTNAEIIFNPNAESIDLYRVKLRGKYGFGNVKKIDLSGTDLTNAEIIFNPNAESIDLSGAKLHGKCSFGNVKEIYLSYADLTNAEVIFNPNAEYIYLYKAKLHGKCSFGNVKKIDLRYADLTNAEIIFNPNAERINLSYAKLHGKYDFSNTNLKEIDLAGADLTNAEIIVGRNTKIIGLDEKYKNKIVVLQSESKVDLLNKGITNLKNRLNIDTQQLTEKISASDREND